MTALLGRLGLLAASIVATLAVLEIGCRLERGRYYLVHWPNLVLDLREGSARYYANVMSHDSELGFVPRAGRADPDGTHDGSGLRLTPPPAGLAARPLLLATGGSFTYGAEVGDAETWPSALQALLRVRVANGGVPGYGLDQIVLRTERLASTLRPDTVVLAFNADNVRRNELSRFAGLEKPHFAQAGATLALQHVPVPLPPTAQQSLSFWERRFGWSVLLDTVLLRLGWPDDWPYDSERELPHGAGERMACPLLQRLAGLGIPVLVVAQYDPDAWEDDHAATAEQQRVCAVVLRCAEAAGLATLDTFSFAGEPQKARSLFKSEGHLGAAGNALIAAAIARRLAQLGRLQH